MRFLGGFVVGMGLGILFAPDKGKGTRKRFKQATAAILDRLQNRKDPGSQSDTGDTGRNPLSSESQTDQTNPLQEAVVEKLNTAKKDELMSVQGIGNATAKRIIKKRPYSSIEEVIENEVLPEATLENVKTQLIEKTEDAA